jgi:hypothetical protein
MKKILLIFPLLIVFLVANAHENPEVLSLEIKKEFNFNYSIKNENLVVLNNKFGNVTVKFGQAKMLRIETEIIVNAINKNLAEQVMEQIKIVSNREGNSIKTETVLSNLERLSNKDPKVKFTINYLIIMPSNMALELSNSFGEVRLPPFSAPLNLNLNFCNLMADNVSNVESKLQLNYGQASLGNLNGTDIKSNFTLFSADEIKNVIFVDNHSELKAKILEDVKGTFNYSHGVFDNVKEALKLKLNYTQDLKLVKIDENIKNLEIISNFSDIALPLSKKFNGAFTIKTVNGTFFIDPDMLINFQKNTRTDNKKAGKAASQANIYEGNIGKTTNGAVKIMVISNFGDVKIND